jgi:hypothetical protein
MSFEISHMKYMCNFLFIKKNVTINMDKYGLVHNNCRLRWKHIKPLENCNYNIFGIRFFW